MLHVQKMPGNDMIIISVLPIELHSKIISYEYNKDRYYEIDMPFGAIHSYQCTIPDCVKDKPTSIMCSIERNERNAKEMREMIRFVSTHVPKLPSPHLYMHLQTVRITGQPC